jgi:WhiB family redox-sensing transcriptional regulator
VVGLAVPFLQVSYPRRPELHASTVSKVVLSLISKDHALPGLWVREAACAGMLHLERAFFPEKGDSVAAAKAVCALCPVRWECLDFALETHQAHGIWGGTTVRERRRIWRYRRRVA